MGGLTSNCGECIIDYWGRSCRTDHCVWTVETRHAFPCAWGRQTSWRLSRNVNYRGYRFDIGGHRFFSKVQYINELWHEIIGKDFLIRPRLSQIHYRGHFFDYLLKAINALTGLGPIRGISDLPELYLRRDCFPMKRRRTSSSGYPIGSGTVCIKSSSRRTLKKFGVSGAILKLRITNP